MGMNQHTVLSSSYYETEILLRHGNVLPGAEWNLAFSYGEANAMQCLRGIRDSRTFRDEIPFDFVFIARNRGNGRRMYRKKVDRSMGRW